MAAETQFFFHCHAISQPNLNNKKLQKNKSLFFISVKFDAEIKKKIEILTQIE